MTDFPLYDPQKSNPCNQSRHGWENEETQRDRQLKRTNRISCFISNNWGKIVILLIVLVALFSADVMQFVLSVGIPVFALYIVITRRGKQWHPIILGIGLMIAVLIFVQFPTTQNLLEILWWLEIIISSRVANKS